MDHGYSMKVGDYFLHKYLKCVGKVDHIGGYTFPYRATMFYTQYSGKRSPFLNTSDEFIEIIFGNDLTKLEKIIYGVTDDT